MKKAVSYSLFGYKKGKYENCFDFESYLSGLLLCVRINRLVYPGWTICLMTDHETYEAYEDLFDKLDDLIDFDIKIKEGNAELCRAMLWRLDPIFHTDNNGRLIYSHVICRDLDSLSTYREAQAVQVWINNGKAAHAITDSVSHTIPMMGGMIGFQSQAFRERMNITNLQELMNKTNMDFSRKGSDQSFLNQVIYPEFSKMGEDSITQHYFKGHANTWLSDFHTCNCWLYQDRTGHKNHCSEDVDLPGVPIEMKETNEISEHIGAAGYNQPQTMRVFKNNSSQFEDIREIESLYPDIFYWSKL